MVGLELELAGLRSCEIDTMTGVRALGSLASLRV